MIQLITDFYISSKSLTFTNEIKAKTFQPVAWNQFWVVKKIKNKYLIFILLSYLVLIVSNTTSEVHKMLIMWKIIHDSSRNSHNVPWKFIGFKKKLKEKAVN
jgi:hypothetical protein